MSTSNSTTRDDSTALGSRENFWGQSDDGPRIGGHTECRGTDPAEYIAHQLALRFVDPVCGKTGAELSEPCLHLPKQIEIGDGQYIEYRQHRHRRRVQLDTGHINWGESTSTDVPEFDQDVFERAVHTYLAEKDIRLTEVGDYLEYAHRVWHDPSMGSVGSLEQFVEHVREHEDN